MKKYSVQVIASQVIEIEAMSEEEAEDIAWALYQEDKVLEGLQNKNDDFSDIYVLDEIE